MKRTVLALLVVILCDSQMLRATSCSVPPPCGRIHKDSILFVGTALDSGVPDGPGADASHSVRVQVDEAFIGLPSKTWEIVVATQGSWLVKGHVYLFDAAREKDGRYFPVMCGATEEVTSEYAAAELAFLRQRAKGKANTSLTVSVRAGNQPVSQADVVVEGPGGPLKSSTDAEGLAKFEGIQAGTYHVTGSRAHYRVDAESGFNLAPTVVVGSCPHSSVFLESEASLSGRVRDAQGAPVASLELELITFTNRPTILWPTDMPFFETKTAQDGTFRFESVSPGRYLLGSNVTGLNTSTIPPTNYPGRAERDGAVPIDVDLGADVGGLDFVLPDFGSMREIQVCVVDDRGAPMSGAGIGVSFLKGDEATASLGDKLVTDAQGCASSRGYARVAYPILAHYLAKGADWRQSRVSETVVIPPGEESIVKVLRLGKPIGTPKPQ